MNAADLVEQSQNVLREGQGKMTQEDTLSLIRVTNNLTWLMRIVAYEQAEYWYDPCGKSGFHLDDVLTTVGQAAVRRAQEICGLA